MCGIVGFSSPHVTPDDLDTLRRVLVESRIRGMHASGVAWYDGKGISSLVKPVPIDQLVKAKELNDLRKMLTPVDAGGGMHMIAHARYSTSDIRYNQPLVGKTFKLGKKECQFAIAHNGVVSQADPSTWKKMYDLTCSTRNDSELLLRAMETGQDPLIKFPEASIAMVWLTKEGKVGAVRNGLRPLWQGHIGEGTVYGSTFSILHRAGVSDIEKLECFDRDSQRRDWTKWIQP